MQKFRFKAITFFSLFFTLLLFYYQAALAGTLTNVAAMPASNIFQENGIHVHQMRTATSGAKSVNITYPAGFNIANAKFIEISGIAGTGTFTISGQTLTYTLGGNTTIGSNVTIKIKIGDIVNGTTLNNTVTFQTKTSAGAVVDSATTPLNLIQVGSAMVSDGAVDSAKILDGSITSTDIADGTVGSADLAANSVDSSKIIDGAVTANDLAANSVDSGKIVDGSVSSADVGFNYAGSATKGGPASDLSCTACVSAGELDFTVPSNPARRIVVASSGGDYTTITAALAAITPSASNPYVIEVMPGTYVEDPAMKSYVHLKGSGREVTTLQGTVAIGNSATNVAVTGLSISSSNSFGIWIDNLQIASNITIANNKIVGQNRGIFAASGGSTVEISGNIIDAGYAGIDVTNSSPRIIGNDIKGLQSGIVITTGIAGPQNPVVSGNRIRNGNYGIELYGTATIRDNTIFGASVSGIVASNTDSSVTIIGNTITGNGNGGWAGIQLWEAAPTIIHNRITGNTPYDIGMGNTTAVPNISFNIYDTLSGTAGVGLYNVKSDGTAAPDP